MSIEIPRAEQQDHRETKNLIRESFWDLYKPGCEEHLVLHQLRHSTAFIPEQDYMACDQGRIMGNIVYTKADVKDGETETEVLCMEPLSVLPAYQRKGIGSLLLKTTIEKARSLGYRAAPILGNPLYYHRF